MQFQFSSTSRAHLIPRVSARSLKAKATHKMEATTIFVLVLLLTFLLLLTVLVYVIYSGLFHTVEVGAGKPAIKNLQIAYKFGRGPYRDTGYVFTEVTSIAPKKRCLGIYYDDPNQVPAHKLRWAVASILSEGSDGADPDIAASFQGKGFKFFQLPEVSNVVRTTFPDRTSLSMLIGIFKVYPLLGEYVKVNKLCAHPWMEVYDGKTIYYMAPLAKQDEFYIPEALDDYSMEDEDEEDEGPMETVKEEMEVSNGAAGQNGDVHELEKDQEIAKPNQPAPTETADNTSTDTAPTDKEAPVAVNGVTDRAGNATPVKVNNGGSVLQDEAATDIVATASKQPGPPNKDSPALLPKSDHKDCTEIPNTKDIGKDQIQDGGVSSSTAPDLPPSPNSSIQSDSSALSDPSMCSEPSVCSTSMCSTERESSSVSYYTTSQSERSNSYQQNTTASEFSCSDSETETEMSPLPSKNIKEL